MYPRTRLLAILVGSLLAWGCGSGPTYQGLSDQDLLRLARTKYEAGDYGDAIKALERLTVSFGTSPLQPDARLLLADAYYAKHDYLTARSEYQRFLDRYPGHEKAPYAALGVCRSLAALAPHPQRDQTYTQQALSVCRNVVVDYAGHEASAKAAAIANEMRARLAEKEYLTGKFYLKRKLYDSAIKYFGFVVDLYPETKWSAWAMLGIVKANEAIGYDDEVKKWKDRLLAEHPDSEAAKQLANGSATG